MPAKSALTRFAASGGGAGRALNKMAATPGVVRGKVPHLDDSVLKKRLREYVKTSMRSIPVALNKAGRNATFRAIRRTPKTTLTQITNDVGTQAAPLPRAYGIYLKNHPGITMVGLRAKVVRMIAAKRSSIAYIAAGFLKAARAFGGTTRDVTPQCLAARGHGIKATATRSYSEIYNTAPGADEMAAGPLEVASIEGLEDMMGYLQEQQKRGATRFNR